LRTLPQVVTPEALDAVAQGALAAAGETASLLEPWDAPFRMAWGPGPAVATGEWDPDLFVWDDPRPISPVHGRWLDDCTFRGTVIVVVPVLEPCTMRGGAWTDTTADDGASMASGLTGGWRAMSAWGGPADDPTTGVYGWCWDGSDARGEAVYAGLWDALQRAKAGGVLIRLWQDGQ
jgi:hypothetical protein